MAYLSLSTANLPDPVIDPAQGASPEDHFNTVLYTGNGSTQSITGVGHQPDFLWFKNRNSTQVHQLFDVVRGVANSLRSNGTDAENTDSPNDRLTSFDSDGFSLGADGNPNGSSNTYVAWSWKANGTGVSNNVGSIPSTVSANTTSGFSVLTYTGNGTNGATIGHGLGATPTFFIVKRRDGAGWSWYTYHKDGKGALGSLYLNASVTGDTDSTFWNDTAPSSSVITLGTANGINQSSGTYVCYAFAPVEGFSAFGKYTGNGSADGPFIYTGFRVKWLMVKRTDSSADWQIGDTVRDTHNLAEQSLQANQAYAEGTVFDSDFISNGFKLRNSGNGMNASGGTYIYTAFAENPFKYSNAR